MSEQEWLSISEVAGALKVGEPTIQHMIDEGLIEAEQDGDSMRISRDALLAFLRADQHTLETSQQPPDVAAMPPHEV